MRLRIGLVLVGMAVVLVAAFSGRAALERLPGFAVERIEIRGALLVSPQEVLEALVLDSGESVWQRPGRWERAASAHPMITSARVSRRLPNGLLLEIEEERPIALLAGETLQPVAADGRILPLAPGRLASALPVMRMLDDDTARAGSAIHQIATLTAERPRLMHRLQEIAVADSEVVMRFFGMPTVEAVLPAEPRPAQYARLEAVLDDLVGRLHAENRALIADLRFEDQVVVRTALPR